MPTNNFFTSAEMENTQRQYLTDAAVLYQNATDVWGMAMDAPKEDINALGIKQPLELSPNPSLAVIDLDGGVTPTIGARNLHNMTISYGQLMAGSGRTYEALLNNNKETAGDQLIRNATSDAQQFAAFLNCYASRGNGTAALAYVDQDDQTSPTITTDGTYDAIGNSQLVVGGWYKFYDLTGATVHEATTSGALQLLSKTATSVTFDQNVPTNVVSGDMIVPVIGTTNAATGFIAGLPYIIDSSTAYFGLSRSTYSGLQSYENGLSGNLTASALVTTYYGIRQRGGYGFGAGQKLEDMLRILMNVSTHQTYQTLSYNSGAAIGGLRSIQDKGSNPGLDLGYKDFEFTWFGAPIQLCNHLRGDEVYFANPKHLRKAVLKNVGMVADGMPQSGWVNMVNSDGVPILAQAQYRDFVGQFWSPTPHKLGKLSGVQFSNVITQKAAQV